ncbi:15898_t:CDS:2 [Acaulospora colombiana]|uniref:15898_t:CDS:1 n=1 Tax=Acaulospora colombiana TaxID=27376 RepID=A0ACA9LJK8_9GLOM|nr:15898_t:CDS:2 [Acaulospora colombiana]
MGSYQNTNYDPEETAGLLSSPGPEQRKARRNLILVFLGAVFISLIAIGVIAVWTEVSYGLPTKRNVILMISDGFGPASETFARDYYQYVNDLPYNYVTPLDKILVGSSRTRSSNSLVTDSAAVNPEGSPCGTILEAAKEIGMVTGLVVTSRITHATPASFSAHVVSRNLEYNIATQQIGDYPLGRNVDLMFGGGRCYFLPNSSEGSCRPDTRDVLSEAKKLGFHYLSTREEFDKLETNSQR